MIYDLKRVNLLISRHENDINLNFKETNAKLNSLVKR